MSYEDKEFWEKYEEFVEESLPRHQQAIVLMPLDKDFILDFGCGRSKEAMRLLNPEKYIGIDTIAESWLDGTRKTFQVDDYREDETLKELSTFYAPTSFTSLFSIECTNTLENNYDLYEKIFNLFPSIKSGAVAGFYYESKIEQETVKENGGIVSYQSTGCPRNYDSYSFLETRQLIPAPSKMFGDDVIEVWKFLKRKKI